MKKGFTIVELMMVIGIIGILLGVVTTAAASSIKQARARKASACCQMVEQAFATYYAQKGRWPGSIGSQIAGGSFSGGSLRIEKKYPRRSKSGQSVMVQHLSFGAAALRRILHSVCAP